MFCGKCGEKVDDDAIFCEHCGEKIERGPVPGGNGGKDEPGGKSRENESGRNGGKNKPDERDGGNEPGGSKIKRIAGIIAVAVVVVGIAFTVVNMFGGRGYEETVEELYELILEADKEGVDIDGIFELFPEKVIENEMEEFGYSRKELTDEFSAEIEYVVRELEDYMVTYEVLDVEKVTGDELDDLKDTYKEEGVRVSAAKNVRMVVNVSFRGNPDERIVKIPVIKIGNSWYIDIYHFGDIY